MTKITILSEAIPFLYFGDRKKVAEAFNMPLSYISKITKGVVKNPPVEEALILLANKRRRETKRKASEAMNKIMD